LQSLGLAFSNFIKKFLTILNFESFSTSFYLLFFSYTLYDSKWSEIFQACSQLALKNEFIELQPFWNFFHNDLTMWSAAARIFEVTKKGFLLLQMLISCDLHGGNFWNFFHIFSNQCLTWSNGYMYPKRKFIKNLLFVLKMAVLECFWWKHSQKPLGVKEKQTFVGRIV